MSAMIILDVYLLYIYYIIQRFFSFATIHLKTKLKWNVANKVKKLWEIARIVLPLQNKYLLNTYIYGEISLNSSFKPIFKLVLHKYSSCEPMPLLFCIVNKKNYFCIEDGEREEKTKEKQSEK